MNFLHEDGSSSQECGSIIEKGTSGAEGPVANPSFPESALISPASPDYGQFSSFSFAPFEGLYWGAGPFE